MSNVPIQIPSYQVAVVGRQGGGLELNTKAAVPQLEDDMILVQNAVVALNPVDMKMAAPHLVHAGAIAGHDFAGTVIAMGPKAWTPVPIKIGDRVCGAVQVCHSHTEVSVRFLTSVGTHRVCID